MGAGVLGDEISMRSEAIAGALDLDDDGVVEEAIEQCGGDDRVAEDVAPFREAAIRGENHGALFVAGVDQLEEEVGAAVADRQIADLVDDQQRGSAVEADLLDQAAFSLGPGQGLDQLGQRAAIDTPAGLHRGDAECGGQVTFSGAW